MWYEEQDQFVRAPTPKTFDNLVQQLEDNDSVLFESIALPKGSLANNTTSKTCPPESPPKKSPPSNKTPSRSVGSPQIPGSASSSNAEISGISDDFIELDDDTEQVDKKGETLEELKEKLRLLEIESNRKLDTIRNKDQIILILRRELEEAKARVNGESPQNAAKSHESVEYYKARFFSTLDELENLKKSLKKDGKVKVVAAKSVRPITPNISQS